MMRQIRNLVHFGRFRTHAPMPRKRKPALLRSQPDLEITNLLEYVVALHGRPGSDFFFVQVGAFDGLASDPLFQLVRKHHWRGVLVEPQPQAFSQLQKNYAEESQLQFFNVALGHQDGEVTLYTRQSGSTEVASVARHLLVKPGHSKHEVVGLQVPCWTVHTLLERAQAPRQIDLLQIDAEGYDFEIIRGIDFSRLRPSIIRYEHNILCERDRNACLELLARHGYRFLLEDVDTTAVLLAPATSAAA